MSSNQVVEQPPFFLDTGEPVRSLQAYNRRTSAVKYIIVISPPAIGRIEYRPTGHESIRYRAIIEYVGVMCNVKRLDIALTKTPSPPANDTLNYSFVHSLGRRVDHPIGNLITDKDTKIWYGWARTSALSNGRTAWKSIGQYSPPAPLSTDVELQLHHPPVPPGMYINPYYPPNGDIGNWVETDYILMEKFDYASDSSFHVFLQAPEHSSPYGQTEFWLEYTDGHFFHMQGEWIPLLNEELLGVFGEYGYFVFKIRTKYSQAAVENKTEVHWRIEDTGGMPIH